MTLRIPGGGGARLLVNLECTNLPTKAKLNSRAKAPLTSMRSQQRFTL